MSQQNQIVDEGKFLYIEVYLAQQSLAFLAPRTGFVEDNSSTDWGGGGWFQDDSRVLHSSSPPAVQPGS